MWILHPCAYVDPNETVSHVLSLKDVHVLCDALRARRGDPIERADPALGTAGIGPCPRSRITVWSLELMSHLPSGTRQPRRAR